MPRKAQRDVIVTLPGITGSVLQKDGKDVWNVSGGAALNALRTLGGSIKHLQLKEDPPDVDDLGDGITAPRVIQDIHLIPGLWKIDGYSKLRKHILETFDVEAGRNFFEFPYDWRRDNRVAARRLAHSSEQWLANWRESSGAHDAKLILVGHSMGGIIARYFLECLDGWRSTRALITFGTPYRGSLGAVGTLANGVRKFGIFDLSDMTRSFTSIHQLLPTYPCLDDGKGGFVRLTEAEVPNVDPAKVAAAAAFHQEIADAVTKHEDDDAYRHDRYTIRPIVGILQPTAQSARIDGKGVRLADRHGDEDLGGDGTVPRPSATPLEFDEKDAMFSAERHASLQNDDHVLLQLTGVTSGISINFAAYREAFPTIGLSVDIDDAYEPGEPITVRARPEQDVQETLVAVAIDTETGAESARGELHAADNGWRTTDLTPLAEGTYRVTVFGSGMVEPVSDVVLVVGSE
jgi:pimeloyl-ACP methyl ester carboxylesterase